MQWTSFTHQGNSYPLDHLHPFSFECVVAAKDGKPEQRYQLNVIFGLHCFTRGARIGEAIPVALAYRDNRETRIFDFGRYEASKRLRALVEALPRAKCFHDTHGNFYVFEVIDEEGVTRYFSVFFTLSKAGKKRGLNLYISSAHMRDERPYTHNVKPIAFRVLVYNTHTGKRVKPAP